MASNTNEKIDTNNLTEMSVKFKQILKSNGIHDSVSEVIVEDVKGDGFSSLTKLVTIKYENPQMKPLHLFVKVPMENESYAEMINELKAFEKEARFLNDYLGAAQEICKSKGCPDFIDFYPKCYYATEDMIVLENLVLEKGYQVISNENGPNLESTKFAIKTLAKHHALGHVVIQEHGGPETFFKKFPILDYETYDKPIIMGRMETAIKNGINSTMKILERNDAVIEKAKETGGKLKDLQDGKAMTIFMDSLKISEENDASLLVFGHGDYWYNNCMYLRDKETNEILHHLVIDFQLTRYNSPSLDLGYYLFTSVQPQLRRANLLELLTLYKDTFNKATEDFGYPTNLTIDQIYRDFRQRVGYGFWLGFIMTIGPGMALFKDVDISKIEADAWPALMERLINKWIDENPEKGKECAEEIVRFVEEYEQLKI